MVFRLIRSLALVVAGAMAGFAGAAALLRRALPSQGGPTSDEFELVAIFDGIELANTSTAFRGGRMLAWFGGIAVDLREATLAPGARLEVRAIFGGVAIRVPSTWRVDATGSVVAGGLDASTVQPESSDAPTLTVDASGFMGGVSIGN
jgi:hypothetical protein